ncbi:MAG: hypothetical protein HYV07_23625 [Deltaproteobacteria bacterium]|nr:hypothetical protein [Deltaproteobacteria bacterium]
MHVKKLLPCLALVVACEDGPEQVFTPYEGDPQQDNGIAPSVPWVQPGEKGFETEGGDRVGRARFCDVPEQDALIQGMVTKPIIPDVSLGGVPLWNADGRPLRADDLVGRPEDGKFCDPSFTYSNAFSWGPTEEVIVFFDEETRLVDFVVAYTQYLGTLSGTFTDDSGNQVSVLIKTRERVKIGDTELDQYASRADQARRTNSWLNNKNVTRIYAMLRETFFAADPIPADYDCVADKICDITYDATNESAPQATFVVFQDSGVQLRFSPEGQVSWVVLEPVRVAPFETAGQISFGEPASTTMEFKFQSSARDGCEITLGDMDFEAFKSACIDRNDDRTLKRVNYDVWTARDAVEINFNGMDVGFVRKLSTSTALRDGESPAAPDELFSLSFSRVLAAPVEEFRPRSLGVLYEQKLERRVREAVVGTSSTGPAHPLSTYDLFVPFVRNDPQAIGELKVPGSGGSWIPAVVEDVIVRYEALSPAEKAMVDPRILEPTFLIEPFVDSVLAALSHGESEGAAAFKVFQTTDDKRWSIGSAHFKRGGVTYRLDVQYSLDFGAVTFITVSRGGSEIDELYESILDRVNTAAGTTEAYYSIAMSMADTAGNSYALGGSAIAIRGFDRRLAMLDAVLAVPGGQTLRIPVSGDPIEDQNGYFKQIRGERWEFVPAHVVRLYGKETVAAFWVEGDGKIGKVSQADFKGEIELCDGLMIRYGDDVRREVEAWIASAGDDAARDCELVYNYSPNGNVLDSVASLTHRVELTAYDGRAVTASIWR